MHYLLVFMGVIAYFGTKLYDDLKTEVNSNPSLNKGNLSKKSYSDNDNQSNIKLATQRRYNVASLSLFFATLSIFFPALILTSVAGIIYTTIPIWRNGFYSLFKKRQFDMAVFDSILFPWLLISKHFLVLALVNWMYYSSKMFAHKVKYIEKNIRATLIQMFGKIPKVVWLLKDGAEIEVPCAELKSGDTIVVSANGIIPVDGVIVNGTTLIDQRLLTGEPKPLQKTVGEQVFAATVVLSNRIFIRVGKSGSETLIAKLVEQQDL